MRLSQLLNENVIKVGLESESKEETFAELTELLVRAGKLPGRSEALQAIEKREELGSTGIGEGIAIPHGKSDTFTGLIAAMGISAAGIEYEAVDDEPVHVVFLVLAEAANPGPHVECLAQIAHLLRVPGFYRRLLACATPKEVLDAVRNEE